ncbi:MAG: cytidylyltransferase [Bryobacterales bacterium]|nr:cytidylyltransferase [Bryobacterales bacterium]
MYYNGTVALEFHRRAGGPSRRLGVLPAAFNPPTRAHLALARAALDSVDEVLFVLPHEFPHKLYADATFDQRLEMLLAATSDEPRYSIAASDRGLFVDIADECRDAYGPETALLFICGRDAAERIVGWDYGEADAFVRMLDRFQLLVAPRGGHYDPPPEIRDRAYALDLPEDISSISATDVRERIRRGEPWEHLVPSGIVAQARRIYTGEP